MNIFKVITFKRMYYTEDACVPCARHPRPKMAAGTAAADTSGDSVAAWWRHSDSPSCSGPRRSHSTRSASWSHRHISDGTVEVVEVKLTYTY